MFRIPKIEQKIRKRKFAKFAEELVGWSIAPDMEVEIDPAIGEKCAESCITPSIDIAIDSDLRDYQTKLYKAMMDAAVKKAVGDVAVVHEIDQFEELKRKWTNATLQIKRGK